MMAEAIARGVSVNRHRLDSPGLPGFSVQLLLEPLNEQLILLYWSIGREILVRQTTQEGWGARVIDRLAPDIR
jgi:hypothetical protein